MRVQDVFKPPAILLSSSSDSAVKMSKHLFLYFLFYTVQLQVPGKYKKLIQRFSHGAAVFTVNSALVEVILFGGQKELQGSLIADPVVLRFGK